MNHEDKQFIPEAVDEQVDYLLELSRRPQPPATFIEPETQLIHDIAQLAKEYQSSHDRVWQHLEEHVHVRNNMQTKAPANAKRGKPNYIQERSPKMQQNLSLGYQYNPRPITRIPAIIAAVLIAALLVGSTIAILTLGRHPGSGPTGSSKQTPNNVQRTRPTPTPSPIDRKYCNSGDTGWDTLCAENQITPIDITKTFTSITSTGDSNLGYTINAGYTDSNRVLFYTTTQAPASMLYPNIYISGVKTKQGTDLPLLSRFGTRDPKNPSTLYSLESFSTADLPQSGSTLDLKLTLSNNGHADTSFVNLSLPFHKARVAKPNQTITANNVAIPLSRVVVGGSSTLIYLPDPELVDLVKHSSPKGTFDVSVFSITAGNWRPSWMPQDAFLHIYANPLTQPLFDTQAPKEGLLITVDAALFDKHGNWTFTISKDAVAGATSDWVFHFTVPN